MSERLRWHYMAGVARAQGSDPGQWFISYRPVPRELWRSVQVWEAGRWVEVLRKGEKGAANG